MDFDGSFDLHMHTTISDGTDTPEELLELVKRSGLKLFSATDHDAVKASGIIGSLMKTGDPAFINGIEFSCRDDLGKYHILAYGYDITSDAILSVVKKGHRLRMVKCRERLAILKDRYEISFSDEDVENLLALDNPGKPHIGLLMVKYGYVQTKEQAIKEILNKIKIQYQYITPEEAISGILAAGGIPVLAHPSYGSGDEIVVGQEMDERLRYLIAMGLKGIEAFYSGFTDKLLAENLSNAEKYDLYVTCGSDYHGRNKLINIGDTNYHSESTMPHGLKGFLKDVNIIKA